MKRFTVVLIALLLGGCALVQRIEAEKQAKELAERNAQLIEQTKAAAAECNTTFRKGNAKIEVDRVKCLNDALTISMPVYGGYQDLVGAYMADRLVIAEKVQSGKMTWAEGNAAIAQRWTEAMNAGEQRANARNAVGAQMAGAVAQQQTAQAANTAAWASMMEAMKPAPNPSVTCTHIPGSITTTCN
jgi:hypothetical protein